MDSHPPEQPPFYNESSAVRKYRREFTELFNNTPEIRAVVGRDERGDPSRAWRFIFSPEQDKPTKVAIFDWDDTLEPYTERKQRFYADCQALLPKDTDQVVKDKFITACKALNKAGRVLPVNGVHPERYAPLLELIGITTLLHDIKSGIVPEFVSQIDHSDKHPEMLARQYVEEHVLPKVPGSIEIQEEGKGKKYFIEKKPQASSIDFASIPNNVEDTIWQSYKTHMTEANIPDSELENHDLPEDVRYIVVTFGQADFQMEKLKNAMKKLQDAGKRVPDEIWFVTRGRKKAIISELRKLYPDMPLVYVDDSRRQVEGVASLEDVRVVQALRKESRSSTEGATPSVDSVQMETTRMSQLI